MSTSKSKFTFTENDIQDRALLERMTDNEALSLYLNPNTRHSREYKTVREHVRQGKVLELFLIETGRYSEASDKYHDLLEVKTHDYIEVKAFSQSSIDRGEGTRHLNRIREGNWNKSKWYLLFKYDKGTYTFLEKIKI